MNEEAEPPPDERAAASMAAFDALPPRFRHYCANYPRTTNGQNLAIILEECSGRVPAAERLLRDLLPTERGT